MSDIYVYVVFLAGIITGWNLRFLFFKKLKVKV